jgi:hypothetical protein
MSKTFDGWAADHLHRGKGDAMRRLAVVMGSLLLAISLTSVARASTTQPVRMTFIEPAVDEDCSISDGFCGGGRIIPLGPATETIEFSAGCAGTCDRRTIDLAGGSIVIDETFSNPVCPGICQTPGGPRELMVSGDLTDVIIGGTGVFEGSTGTLVGTVRAEKAVSQVKLSGTITPAS